MMETQELKSGIYFVKLETQFGMYSERMIVIK
jgi:hypothetical protein